MFIISIIELSAVPIVMIIICAVLFKQSKSQTKTYGFRALVPATIAIAYALINAFVICPLSFGENSIKKQVPLILVVSILSGIVVILSIANIIYCLVKNSSTIEQPSNKIQNKSGSLPKSKSKNNKYGFTLEDYDDLSEDQWLTYQSLSDEKQRKFVDSYLQNHPNYDKFQYISDLARDSILKKGFYQTESLFPKELGGHDYNRFLVYLNNINVLVHREVAEIILYFFDRGELDPHLDLLYQSELYEGTNKQVVFKIKAIVYALNDVYQAKADRHIKIDDLMDKNGVILTYNEIIDILNEIKVNPVIPTNKE